MSVNEKMTAIADAIRAHTGGTEPLGLDAMAEAIAGLEVGGGLPERITAIDCGWFALTTNYGGSPYNIAHNLNEYPDIFVLFEFTSDESSGLNNGYIATAYISNHRTYTSASVYYEGDVRLYGGGTAWSTTIPSGKITDYITNQEIKLPTYSNFALKKGFGYVWAALKFAR